MPPELRLLCVIEADVGAIRDLGPTHKGRRRIVPILGGSVTGARLQADVMPGGADWQHERSDGVLELTARYSLLTKDGVEIAITNHGLRRAPQAIMERLSRGEAVDPALVYFRTVPVFEAPIGRYDWLNKSIFLATAARHPGKVQITVFEVA